MIFKKIINSKLNWLLLLFIVYTFGWIVYAADKFSNYISFTESNVNVMESVFAILFVISIIGIIVILLIKLVNFIKWLISKLTKK